MSFSGDFVFAFVSLSVCGVVFMGNQVSIIENIWEGYIKFILYSSFVSKCDIEFSDLQVENIQDW